MSRPVWIWLGSTFLLSMAFAAHALWYLRSSNRDRPHWLRVHIVLTFVVSMSWAMSIWVLPLAANPELKTAVLVAIVGVTTTGSSLLVGFRWLSRTWMTPPLVSITANTLLSADPFAAYWLVFCTGIFVLHWRNAARKETHLSELLRLRYANEDLVEAKNLALEEAQELGAAKSRFLAAMSHEMRTPLHGILGLTGMLSSEPLTAKGQHHLRLLRGTGEHLLSVINDVLDFSKLRADSLVLHPEPTDIRALLEGVCELTAMTGQGKDIQMLPEVDLPPHARWSVDSARLKQILINLAANAVKFTTQGHVKVAVHLDPAGHQAGDHDRLHFSVIDTGIGIPAHQIDKIFNAFYQVAGASGQGTGLGLSIARDLCEAMGGQLRCESTVGVGSRFDFTLSLIREPQCELAPGAPPGPDQATADLAAATGPSVLVVDDNPVNLLVTQAQLAQLGLNVHCVSSGLSALDWLESHAPAIVFLDCHMPDMDGFATARAIRLVQSHGQLTPTRIVGLTASNEASVAAECLASGMDRVICKPCTVTTLSTTVREMLARWPATSVNVA